MAERIQYEYGSKTVMELIHLQENGCLNLEPGFQRKSVWTVNDRRKLVQSVLEGYPMPSIFLYRRNESGAPVYDVIDGKQRLETLFMFSRSGGFRRDGFELKFQFEDDDRPYVWGWRELIKWDHTAEFLGYKIQTVEVRGDLSDIIDLFVRINSTGKSLTSSEKRHARYYRSPFLKEADRLAKRYRPYLLSQRVVSESHISRMKDVELITELLASIVAGGPIHGKESVDKAVGNEGLNAHTLRKASSDFQTVLKALKRMFPELHATRFRNMAEFYTLFMVVWDLQQQKMILTDRKRNRTAEMLLKRLSNGVDEVRELQRNAKGAGRGQQLYADYLLSVQRGTDDIGQRKRRAQMMQGLLAGLFEKKDERRLFSPEQRRLLWNSEEKRKCRECGEALTWTNFQADHIKPHSRGGRTELVNAALVCQPCNASKGAKRRARTRKHRAA